MAVFAVGQVGFLSVAVVGFGLIVVRHSGVGVALVSQPNRASQPYAFLPLPRWVSVGKVRIKYGKQALAFCLGLGKVCILKPNKSVKGTRRPLAR